MHGGAAVKPLLVPFKSTTSRLRDMITILHGADRLSINERISSVRALVDSAGISTTFIDDASTDVMAVQAACGAVGFFGSGRLVIARDLLSTAPERGRKSLSEAERDSVVNLLGRVPAETTLLVVERLLDQRIEREIRKVVTGIVVERFDVPRGQRLVDWTCERARRYRAIIGQSQARLLLEALFPGNWQAESTRDDVPPDVFRLDSEIAKLATAAGDEGNITTEHVSVLVPGAEAENFWGITNAIMSGDPGRAVIEIERAYGQGSAPEAILGQITSQFEVLAVASLAGPNMTLSALAAASGLSEPRLRQSARYSTTFPASRIASALDALRDLDASVKQGDLDLSAALVPLVASLASGSHLTAARWEHQ